MYWFRLTRRANDENLAVYLVPALVRGCFEEELILPRVEKAKVNGALIGGGDVFWLGCCFAENLCGCFVECGQRGSPCGVSNCFP